MTREFKPGDKVRLQPRIRVISNIEPSGTHHRLAYFEDGGCGLVDNFELVEPSVTRRELREVLSELKQRDPANTSWSAALEAYFFQLTGEQA